MLSLPRLLPTAVLVFAFCSAAPTSTPSASATTTATANASSDILWFGPDVRGTIYYDVNEATTGQICAARFQEDNWSANTVNSQPPKCEEATHTARSLTALNTSRIVAIDWNFVEQYLDTVCGKEVEVYLPNGEKYEMDEGPFVLWDSCGAAETDYIVDFSAKAVVGMWQLINGGDCMSGNPGGLTVIVTNRQVPGFELPSYGPAITTPFEAGHVLSDAYTSSPAPAESMAPCATCSPVSLPTLTDSPNPSHTSVGSPASNGTSSSGSTSVDSPSDTTTSTASTASAASLSPDPDSSDATTPTASDAMSATKSAIASSALTSPQVLKSCPKKRKHH